MSPTGTRQLRIPAWIVLAILFPLLFSGCNRQSEYAPPPPMEVTVSKPVQRAVTDYAEFTGTLDSVESVEIRARVEGTLENVRFKDGARVKKGDLLFVIDPKPFQAKVDEAKAELERRQAELKQSEATLKMKEQAFKANAVSEIEIIQSRADLDVAKAAIQAALAALETADLNLSYTRIHAPISGRISRNFVDVGNLVGAGDRTLLATLVNDERIYAYFSMNERDLLHYQQQQQGPRESPTSGNGKTPVYLGLSTQPGYPFEGRIDYVDNRLDASTGTIQIRGVFSNPNQQLWPGLFARVRIPIGSRENALLVPDVALGTDQRGQYLLVVNAQNTVDYRPVETGALLDNHRVIESGISPEDRVIVSGLQRARPGLAVKPVEAAPPATASASPQPGPQQ